MHFHKKNFDTLDALKEYLVDVRGAVETQNGKIKGIAAWEWIFAVVSISN